MKDLLHGQKPGSAGPVECLGQTFQSELARHEYYCKLLAEHLKTDDCRKIDGFPIATDEAILKLSRPPFYTACPNPFIEDFIKFNGTPHDQSIPYSKAPFAADVSEGKQDPIYNAHSYHTKVPHKAIMRYILHYTQPGDLIFDGFCGTGMTGVAAQLCGDRNTVSELGYKIDNKGNIFEEELQEGGQKIWVPFSKIGARNVILNDLAPAATFIASNYNTPFDLPSFEEESNNILNELERSHGWMYQTKHTDGRIGKINFTIWSDVFICGSCSSEIIFWDSAIDKDKAMVLDEFSCRHCGTLASKKSLERAWTTIFDAAIGKNVRQKKQVPVLINYCLDGSNVRYEKAPDNFDLDVISRTESETLSNWFPTAQIPLGDKTSEPINIGTTHVHHFYTRRNLIALAKVYSLLSSNQTKFLFTGFIGGATKLNQLHLKNYIFGGGGVNPGPRKGVIYSPSISLESSVPKILMERLKTQIRAFQSLKLSKANRFLVTTGSAAKLFENEKFANTLDYVFIDPPFGSNLMYSELSHTWESWLNAFTNNIEEAIENKTQKKSVDEYRVLMTRCFSNIYFLLKPGRWMTVEFSNTQAHVWNNIQSAISNAGFIVGNVSVLDKKQGGINAIVGATAVKQDLVISAYKPDGELENRFIQSGGSEDSVWDFVRSHLKYIPVVKRIGTKLDFIAERDPRIIFDRMVAWYVRHNAPVPMSSQEFQVGLKQRFPERDGMIFLSDQTAEYDKKRMMVVSAPQMELFVSDERSAIDWLTNFIKSRPSTYQEIHPEFISQLGAGWKKHEEKPELSDLLEANFIQYDGNGDVPSQIHSYLSTNHKDLRSLDKHSPLLIAKAKDRWYVPDPNKGQDLEKKREKALLKEFEGYQLTTGRKLKEFRLEVLRAGFKAAWGAKNYKAIIAIAHKIPEEALQEDEKLLLWYDQALTRMESGA
jgi:DNA modification methylase